ncbi:hypothetical protein D1AOALGA4SA_8077 [Olavius algarvensis Delta 1 endosymbiont]|nr:hypothetical protein D1AOALGA4SA_8077 [Olavius algarvensis Delta 1 endosymbiont]
MRPSGRSGAESRNPANDSILLDSRLRGNDRRITSKDPGPEDPALSSPQRGGVYLGLQME